MGSSERRKGERVTFERGIPAHMMGIDGTWRRDCIMEDVAPRRRSLTSRCRRTAVISQDYGLARYISAESP